MNARFARLLAAARAEVLPDAAGSSGGAPPTVSARESSGPAHPPRGLLYRRAVPTDARAGAAPPPLPVAGLRIASNGVAVLVPEEFPGGRFDEATVDSALHAARAAGATWAAAWVADPSHVAMLRDLGFLPMPDAAS